MYFGVHPHVRSQMVYYTRVGLKQQKIDNPFDSVICIQRKYFHKELDELKPQSPHE